MAIGNKDKVEIDIDVNADNAKKSVKGLTSEFKVLKAAVLGGIVAGAIYKINDAVIALAQNGSKVDGLTRAFNELQASVGVLGNTTLSKLRESTKGLISDFDLMSKTNDAVLLGLPIEGFEKMAAAAAVLGLAVGRTAKEGLSDLVVGVGRASREILDNIGVLVDANTAQLNYANSIGVTVASLTEEQRKLAFQAEAYKQIEAKAASLTGVQIDTGNSFNLIGVALRNLFDESSKTINSNTELASTFQKIAETINEIDVENLINALGRAGDAFATLFSGALSGINYLLEGWNDLLSAIPSFNLDNQLQVYKNLSIEATNETKILALEISKLGKEAGLEAVAPKIEILKTNLQSAREEFKKSSEEVQGLKNRLEELSKIGFSFGKMQEIAKLKEDLKQAELAILPIGNNLEIASKKLAIFTKLQDDLSKTIKKQTPLSKEQIKSQDDYNKALEKLKDTLKVITESTGTEKYIDQVEDLTRKKKLGAITNDDYSDALLKIAKDANFSAQQLEIFTDRIKNIDQEIRKSKTGLDQLFGQDSFLSNAISGTSIGRGINSIASSLGEEVSQQVANGLNNSLQNVLQSGNIREEAGNIGATLGGAVGGKFGEAYGQKLGEAIGKIGKNTGGTARGVATVLTGGLSELHGLGGLIQGAFGANKNDEANARQGFVKFITNVLDERQLQLVIDGQLQKLNFNLTGGRDAFDAGGLFNTAFEGMDQSVISGFSGIGQALASPLDGAFDGSQLGAILADNLGNLNNLQILLGRLDISAEEMGESVKEAWLMGDLSANEALGTLNQINNITSQGIPDGLGLTGQAFDNIIASAGNGEIAMDAFGDIAVEATEKGIGSLEGLREELISSGKDINKVNEFFNALSQAGVSSLEDLKNISVDTGLQLASILENTPDFFADKIEKLEDLKNKIDEIENKEVDIKFNFKSSIDSNTQKAIDSGAFSASGTENIGAEGTF